MKDYFSSWPRIVVNLMLMAAQTRGNEHPATGHQTLMMLDEFATMERMKRIETAAADIAGAGVKMFMVVQSLTQLKAIYGENWETFASCADTHIYYGFNDNFTAEYVSKRLGEVEVIRTTRSQSSADNTTITDGKSKGGSSSIAENTSDARSKGGGRGTSRGGSSGTSDSTGWGPSIFFRTLATTNQFARQSGRNYGTSRQENYRRTKTKGTTKTKGDNWGETHLIATGRTRTLTEQESLHKKPLAAINELMRLFGDVEDENDPTYPGIGLISTASRDPMLIHKCHYDEDRFFEGLFDPHPKWGFLPIPEAKPLLQNRKLIDAEEEFGSLPETNPVKTFGPNYDKKILGPLTKSTLIEGLSRGLSVSKDGKSFFLASEGGLYRWDLDSNTPCQMVNHSFNLTMSCISEQQDDLRIASIGVNNNLYVWAEGKINNQRSIQTHLKRIEAIAFIPGRDQIIVAGDGLHLWGIKSGSKTVLSEYKHTAVHPLINGVEILALDGAARLSKWDLRTREKVWEGKHQFVSSFTSDLAVSQDERLALVAVSSGQYNKFNAVKDRGNGFAIWDLTARSIRHEIKLDGTSAVALSPDGRLAATYSTQTGFSANSVVLWDTESGTPLYSAKGGRMIKLRFSPDGQHLFGADEYSSRVTQWDLSEMIF